MLYICTYFVVLDQFMPKMNFSAGSTQWVRIIARFAKMGCLNKFIVSNADFTKYF